MNIQARYQDRGGSLLKGTVRNLSRSGAFIETRNPLKRGEEVDISFDARDFGRVICISSRVIRSIGSKGMAVCFIQENQLDLQGLIDMIKSSERASMMHLSRAGML